jgi:hypothetical protein
MKVLGAIVVLFGCGGRLAPNATPDASDGAAIVPADYKVAAVDMNNRVVVWHSHDQTTTIATVGPAGGPAFSFDGHELAVDMWQTPQSLTFIADDGGVQDVALAEPGSWPSIRRDGQRFLLLADGNCTNIYDRNGGVVVSGIGCNLSWTASYGPDRTIVFSRAVGSGASEIVTMLDDGTNEEVVVPASPNTLNQPASFSFDGAQIVFLQMSATSTTLQIVNRSSHQVRTIPSPVSVMYSPKLTPDGTAVIFEGGPDDVDLLRLNIATGTIDVLIPDLQPANKQPLNLGITVAPE